MLECCGHADAASGLFSRLARYYRLRYQIIGLERTQRQLVAGLDKVRYQGASLLEIGCGVGYLHQWLLRHGASKATGVDLSASMLAEAEKLASQQGLADRVRYLQGDFLAISKDLESADITLLDKVICCYPDAKSLLACAVSHTNRAIALTYPRDIWLTRLSIKLLNSFLAWRGSEFRTFVHDPQKIEQWINAQGFRKCYQNQTWTWLTHVYERE